MTSPDIAVLTTGSELLNGDLTDTNTGTIGRSLNSHGYRVRYSISVADSEEDICQALSYLLQRAKIVIVTGGLGSTGDDLTARAAAKLIGRPLVINDEALRMIRDHFSRRNRPAETATERQAMLPQKAVPLPNSRGTAPGFWLQQQGCHLFFIPGVPHEMSAMLESAVIPAIIRTFPAGLAVQQRQYSLFGLAEPKIEQRVPYGRLPQGVDVAFGLSYPLVLLKLCARGDAAEQRLDQAEMLLFKALGDHIVAREGETHAGQVGRLLTGKGLTLSLAESCTGGLIARMLTREPGASAFLERAAVTYADSAKLDWLNISPELLQSQGAVSEACALAMVRGIRLAADTDLALAVTGIAGPDGGSTEKPVGTVFLALAAEDTEQVQRYQFSGDRNQVQLMTAHMGLEWLRRYSLEH
ncbi:MAG: CinA family nicotinamide mononucleotide deamidase-related protein [Desulfuromonadales bacterium]|jgi:nicotinamide-nucleotide amidase|nr:CinA family nicotinamide mononucleotide deamidase-related protein [Desulfuromonadales bacterium]